MGCVRMICTVSSSPTTRRTGSPPFEPPSAASDRNDALTDELAKVWKSPALGISLK
jgi:hypothetical protein